MIAALHQKMAAGIGVTSLFYRFNPGAKNTQRNLMFTLAGGGAGVAADTLALVNYETVTHFCSEPPSSSSLLIEVGLE
jgi:hypothetical protein